MYEISIQQQLTKYPYLKILIKYFLLTTKDDIAKLRTSETINIDNEEIPIALLEKILTDETYYNYPNF